jgi:transcriptional regulator with XRE-family HTH domain
MIRRIRNGKELRAWRLRIAITARQLAELIGVTERTVHRAEESGTLGVKLTLSMELLLTRLQHGEIDLPSSLGPTSRRGRPPSKERTLVVGESTPEYIADWHGKISSGSDIKRWRRSVGLWQKDLAVLLGVAATTMNRAERSSSPSPGVIYGVELLRKQIIEGEFDLDAFRKIQDKTLPRKKKQK